MEKYGDSYKIKWNLQSVFFMRVYSFSSPLFRTSVFRVRCSESIFDHDIMFPDVREGNWSDVRNEKIRDVREIKWRMFGTKNDGCSK